MQNYSIFSAAEIKSALVTLNDNLAYHRKNLLLALTETDVRYHAEKLEQHTVKIAALNEALKENEEKMQEMIATGKISFS